MGSDKLNVFVSYSHKDKAWLERVQVHLKPLARDGKSGSGTTPASRAGQRWRDEIKAALAQADVANPADQRRLLRLRLHRQERAAPALGKERKVSAGSSLLGVHINYSDFENDKDFVRAPDGEYAESADRRSRGARPAGEGFSRSGAPHQGAGRTPRPLGASPGATEGGRILGRLNRNRMKAEDAIYEPAGSTLALPRAADLELFTPRQGEGFFDRSPLAVEVSLGDQDLRDEDGFGFSLRFRRVIIALLLEHCKLAREGRYERTCPPKTSLSSSSASSTRRVSQRGRSRAAFLEFVERALAAWHRPFGTGGSGRIP